MGTVVWVLGMGWGGSRSGCEPEGSVRAPGWGRCALGRAPLFRKRRASLHGRPVSLPPSAHAAPRGEEEEEERRRGCGLQPPPACTPGVIRPVSADRLVVQRGRGGRGRGAKGRVGVQVPWCVVGGCSLSLRDFSPHRRGKALCALTSASACVSAPVCGYGYNCHCCPLGLCVAPPLRDGRCRFFHGPGDPHPIALHLCSRASGSRGRAPSDARSFPIPSCPPPPPELITDFPANMPINAASVIKPCQETTNPGLPVPAWKINPPQLARNRSVCGEPLSGAT